MQSMPWNRVDGVGVSLHERLCATFTVLPTCMGTVSRGGESAYRQRPRARPARGACRRDGRSPLFRGPPSDGAWGDPRPSHVRPEMAMRGARSAGLLSRGIGTR